MSKIDVPTVMGLFISNQVLRISIATKLSPKILYRLKFGIAINLLAPNRPPQIDFSLTSLRDRTHSSVLPNIAFISNLYRFFSKSFFAFVRNKVFRSMYDLSHGLCLNCKTRWTFNSQPKTTPQK